MQRVVNSGIMNSFNGSPVKDDDDELSKSALATFVRKEEEIQTKKMEIKEKVQSQLGIAEEATKRLAEILDVSTSRRINNLLT